MRVLFASIRFKNEGVNVPTRNFITIDKLRIYEYGYNKIIKCSNEKVLYVETKLRNNPKLILTHGFVLLLRPKMNHEDTFI